MPQTRGRGGYAQRAGRTRPGGGRGTFFELLTCSIHSIERYRNTRGQIKDVSVPYRRQLKKGEKRGECGCDYYSYAQLDYERKSLSDEFKSLPKQKILPFLLFPAEVRNRIYEDLFVLQEPIEFCPEPFIFDGTDYLRTYEHCRSVHHNNKYIKKASNR